jgi:hypothetical protein
MFPDTESGLSTISVMGGSIAGTYSLTAPRFGYSRAEMYFLGLASPAEVSPITFVQNGTTSQITIDQIVGANGPRAPAYAAGQTRVFRVPTFVVKRAGENVSDAPTNSEHALPLAEPFHRETGWPRPRQPDARQLVQLHALGEQHPSLSAGPPQYQLTPTAIRGPLPQTPSSPSPPVRRATTGAA